MIGGLGLLTEQAIQINSIIGRIILVMNCLSVVVPLEVLNGKKLKFSAFINIQID